MNNNFYDFGSRYLSTSIEVSLSEDEVYRSDTLLKLFLGEYQDISFPIVFKRDYGKKKTDIITTGTPYLYLISENMKGVLEKNNITGCKIFTVRIVDKKDNEIKGYFGLSITGRSSPAKFDSSNIIIKRLIPEGPEGEFYKGLVFDKNTWDGKDMFIQRSF